MPPHPVPETIETDRVIVRTAMPGDGPIFNRAVLSSLPELSPWLGWVRTPPSMEDSEASCRRAYEKFLALEDMMAFIFSKEDGELIGGSGLHYMDWTLRCFEVGYWGRTGYVGKGLITEGVRALADFALDGLKANRVFLTTDNANMRSWRLAERAGFELEGILRNERLDLDGKPRDTRVYARVPNR
ncbi:GNAT family N-acetyltransferase [Luteolibacter luteus]|nr:GNAT family protein [Luteolibacter luteus]